MFTRPTIKSVFGKVSRSGLDHCITVILPVKHATEQDTGFDALGGLTVVGLSVVTILLMRFILGN